MADFAVGVRQVLALVICLPALPFLWLASKVAPKPPQGPTS